MTPEAIIQTACNFALAILALAFLLTVYRVVRGPALPDRVMALDMLVGIAIGFIGVIAIRTGYPLYIDIAIALGLVGFLATVAFARFILTRGTGGEPWPTPASVQEPGSGKRKGKRAGAKKPSKTAHGDGGKAPVAKPPGSKRSGR